MGLQHSPIKDKKSDSKNNQTSTTDSGISALNLDETASENKTTDEKITSLTTLVQELAVAGNKANAKALETVKAHLATSEKALTNMLAKRLVEMQKEIENLKKENEKKETNFMIAETENKLNDFDNRFNNLENQLKNNADQLQEQIKNQITDQLKQQVIQMKKQNDKFGSEIRQTLHETMDNIHDLNKIETPVIVNNNLTGNNGNQQLSQNSTTSQPRTANVSEDDRISKKQALSLLSSGKIPTWNESESLRKFLKNTVKIFAEDSNQKPVHIAMWIHKCFASHSKLQPQRLKDIAAEIISENGNISINSFLKKFGENLQPSETTPFNFKRESNETVQDAVYRLLEEYESIEVKHIAQALVVNESDRWIHEKLKQQISFSDDISAEELKAIAKRCDKECRINLNMGSDDKTIELDYFRGYNPNTIELDYFRGYNPNTIQRQSTNQRQLINQNYRQNYRPQQTLFPKFCDSCREKFVPRFGTHRYCNDCFYSKIVNQNNRNNYQNRPNKPFYQPTRPLSQPNQINNRNRTSFHEKSTRRTGIRNFNSTDTNTVKVMNLNDLADQIYNIEDSLKSRLGIEIPAKNDDNEVINCFGLLDSGANKNVVAEDFLSRNKISFRRKRPTYAETANPNAKIDIIGTASIRFGRNNEICNFEVTKQNLGENSSFDFILGTPFLEEIGVMDQIRQSAENYSLKNM